MTCGTYVKDLSILYGLFEAERILLVDNLAACYALQVDSGVPILPYEEVNFHDNELLSLIKYLKQASAAKKLRKFNKKALKVKKIKKCKGWDAVRRVYT